MNVALAYNVKPESDTFTEILPPIRSDNLTQTESVIETYAEWDTWETINALKEAIEVYHDVNLIDEKKPRSNWLAFAVKMPRPHLHLTTISRVQWLHHRCSCNPAQ